MSSVDNRIVNMQFNNARFEKNAKESMSTLDKLKEKLKFKDVEKDMKEFQSTADSFSLDHMANAVDKIANKFTLLGQIGYQAIERIASKVLDLGETMARSVSVDQISAGFEKYKEETNTVQAMIEAVKDKGYGKDSVYEALDKLLAYSDATSYSYTQMTTALSTFIASGQDLFVAEQAIEGVANAAALSGVSIGDASVAFRNFSDAMSKGYFLREDWKSLQYIRMDTENLREEFIKTAKDLKILNEQGMLTVDPKTGKKLKTAVEVNANSFLQTLSYGWLNTDVMMQTLARYADTSEGTIGEAGFNAAKLSRTFEDVMDTLKDVVSTGWKETFKLIFGDIDEATGLFSSISDTVSEALGGIGEFRNMIFQGWRNLGGRDSMIQALKNIWEMMGTIGDVLSPIATAFLGIDAIVPEARWQWFTNKLWKFTNGIRDGIAGFTEWIQSSEQLHATIQLVADALKWIRAIGKGVWGFFVGIWDQLKPTLSALWDLVNEIFGDLFGLGDDAEKQLARLSLPDYIKNLTKLLEPITSRLPKIIAWIKKTYERIRDFLNTNPRMIAMREATVRLFNAFIKFIPGAINSLIEFGKQIWNTIKESEEWKWIKTNFEKYVKPVGQFIWDFVVEAKNALADFFEMDTSGETGLWNKLKKRFSAFDRLGPWFEKKWAELKEKIPFLQKVEDWWNTSPFIREMKQFFKTVGDAINAFFSLSFEGTDLEKGGSIFAKLKARWDAAWSLLKPYFEQKWDQFSKWWQSIDWKQLLHNGVTKLGDFFKNLFSPNEADKGSIGAKIRDVLQNVGKWISDAFHKLWTGIFGSAEKGSEEASKDANAGGDKDVWTVAADKISEKIKPTTSALEYIKKKIGDALTDAWNAIKDFFEKNGITFDKIYDVIKKFLKLRLLWNAGYMMRKFGKVGKGLSDMFESISGTFDELSKGIKNGFKKKLNWSEKLKNVGIALLAVAASVWIIIQCIEQINKMPEDDFWEGAKRIGIIMAAITAMLVIINLSGKKDSGKIGSALKPLLTVIAIALMVNKFIKINDQLKNIKNEEMLRTALWIGAIMALLALILYVDSKYSDEDTKTARILLSAIGIALMIKSFAKAILTLSDIDQGTMSIAALWVDSIVALLALVIYADSKNDNGNFKILLSALGVAALLYVYSKAVERLAKFSQDDLWMPALFIDSIVALLALLTGVSKGSTTKSLVGEIGGLVAMALLVWVYAEALTKIKDLDPTLVLNFSIAIDLLVVAVVAMAGAMVLLGKADVGAVAKGAVIMVIAAAAIGAAIALILELVKGAISDFSDTIAHVGAQLAAYNDQVKDINFEDLGDSVDFIVTIAGTLVAVGTMNYGDLSGFITNLVHVAGALGNFNDEVVKIKSMERLRAATKAIRDMAKDLDAMPNIDDKSTQLARVGGAIGIYAQSVRKELGGNEDLDVSNLPDASSIMAVFKALSGAFTGGDAPTDDELAEVGSFATEDRATALTNFAIGLENIATAMANLSETASTLNFGDVNQAISALGQLSNIAPVLDTEATISIGDFSITLHQKKESLDNFALDIRSLGNALAAFSTCSEGMNFITIWSAITALGLIKDINNALPSEGGLKGLLLGEQDLSSFAANIRLLGDGAKAFSESIVGGKFDSTEGIMDNATSTLLALAKMNSKLPNTGGLRGILVGNPDLTHFAENLGGLGAGAVEFAAAVTNGSFTNISVIRNAANVLQILAEVNDTIPETEGIKEWFTGKKDLQYFASNLEGLGEGAVSFANAIKGGKFGDDMSVVKGATDIIVALAEANAALPAEGGLVGWFAGEQSFKNLSANLPDLGEAAVAFAETVSGSESYLNNIDAIQKAADVILILAKANAALPKVGGIRSWFEGDNSAQNFKEGLEYLAHGIIDFVTILSTKWDWKDDWGDNLHYDLSMINDTTLSAVQIVSDIASKMNGMDRVNNTDDWDNLKKYFETYAWCFVDLIGTLNGIKDDTSLDFNWLATMMSYLGQVTEFTKYYNGLQYTMTYEVDPDIYEDSLGWLQWMFDYLSTITPGSIDGAVSALESLSEILTIAATADFETVKQSYADLGKDFLDAIFSCFKTDPLDPKVVMAIHNVMTEANTKARKYETNFYNTGIYMMRGLGNGIMKNKFAVLNAVNGVLGQAVNTAHAILGINSPSKVFEEMGMYSDQGLANGFMNYSGLVEHAVENVSSTAMNTALNEIKALADISLENLDIQPTIRPVLDTENIAAGIGYIDDIFRTQRTLKLDTRSLDAKAQLIGTNYSYDLVTITQQVQGMNERLDRLAETMTQLQVVMDSGELVGSLENKIDQRMGARARRGERGN